MRSELAKIKGLRQKFEGIFVRFGSKRNFKGYPQPTLLLKDIREVSTGKIISDHIWFTIGKRLGSLILVEGDKVRFDARVTPYEKGYKGYREDVYDSPIEIDYRLSFPTNITKVSTEETNPQLLKLSI